MTRHQILIVWLVAAVGFVLAALAQPSPAIAQVESKPVESKPESKPPELPAIAFFLATGEPNACGPGCHEWIAADGRIDLAAPQRFRALLAKLGTRRPPLFLNSPGGAVMGALALGRLLRSEKLEASVARTIPAGCTRGQPRDLACEALMRSGDDLASDIDPTAAICNSACVLVLSAGAVRSVPPWVKLGVHAIGMDHEDTLIPGASIVASKTATNAHIVEFLHDMGISKELFDTADAVPHLSGKYLERDELVRFGIDTRSFGETSWRFVDKPMMVQKEFFVRTGEQPPAYPNVVLRVSCGAGKLRGLSLARQRPANVPVDATMRPLRIAINGQRVSLANATKFGIDSRATFIPAATLDAANDKSAITIDGFDPGRVGPDSLITLSMAGFSAAYAKLRDACTVTSAVNSGCSLGEEISHACIMEALTNRK